MIQKDLKINIAATASDIWDSLRPYQNELMKRLEKNDDFAKRMLFGSFSSKEELTLSFEKPPFPAKTNDDPRRASTVNCFPVEYRSAIMSSRHAGKSTLAQILREKIEIERVEHTYMPDGSVLIVALDRHGDVISRQRFDDKVGEAIIRMISNEDAAMSEKSPPKSLSPIRKTYGDW